MYTLTILVIVQTGICGRFWVKVLVAWCIQMLAMSPPCPIVANHRTTNKNTGKCERYSRPEGS